MIATLTVCTPEAIAKKPPYARRTSKICEKIEVLHLSIARNMFE